MPDPDIVTWLRSILHNDRSVELRCQEAANEIERLREERDEARREVCSLRPFAYHNDGIAKDYAAYRKWDCFKEDTNG